MLYFFQNYLIKHAVLKKTKKTKTFNEEEVNFLSSPSSSFSAHQSSLSFVPQAPKQTPPFLCSPILSFLLFPKLPTRP